MYKVRTKLFQKLGIVREGMIKPYLPNVVKDIIVPDAMKCDITAAPGVPLLEILWQERYLTRLSSLPESNGYWKKLLRSFGMGRHILPGCVFREAGI